MAEADADRRDPIRQTMVGIFDELGPNDPLAREHRKRLATALY
jgi:putative thioredoxin